LGHPVGITHPRGGGGGSGGGENKTPKKKKGGGVGGRGVEPGPFLKKKEKSRLFVEQKKKPVGKPEMLVCVLWG